MQQASSNPKRLPAGLPEATAFVASFCVMVIELVAGRIISRHLGSSLYTWTAVIGIVLAGLAAGNALGGRLADRRPAIPTLSLLFLGASASCIVVLVANRLVGEWVVLWTLSWPVRIALHVFLVFFIPSMVLGTISPVAAKMAVERSTRTGQAIGNVSAWGVVGSILGTFATGYYLVAAFGTTLVVWGVAAALALVGILFGVRSRAARIYGAALVALAVLAAAPTNALRKAGETLGLRDIHSPNDLYVDESQYSHIRIARAPESPDRRYLHLDKLVHSVIIEGKPLELDYGYARVYSAVTKLMAAGRDSLNTLTIGGGGYTFPRWLDLMWPKSRTVVAEIDPAVTKAVIAAFELPAQNRLVIRHEDGRIHLQQIVERRRLGQVEPPYDFIYLDVFNDYSVPYQLTTLECMRLVDQVLGPNGAFLMNMIDAYGEGRFLAGMISTLAEVFPTVKVFAEGRPVSEQPLVRNTYVLVASKKDWDSHPVTSQYEHGIALYEMNEAERQRLLERTGRRPLTDDWSPIENLLAPVVRESSQDIAAAMLVGRAEAELAAGHADKAIRACEEAIRLNPADLSGRRILANALAAKGDTEGSMRQYEEILRIRPSSSGARVQLATALVRQKRNQEALVAIEEAIRSDPHSGQAQFIHGIILEGMSRPDEAIAAYEQSVKLDPKNLEARNNLGIAYARAGRNEEAIQAFEETLRIDPNFKKAQANLQRAKTGTGRAANGP
jgi:tetratricopeptide (TPR) repeat protein/predicted membrane-bound spermidine synthase